MGPRAGKKRKSSPQCGRGHPWPSPTPSAAPASQKGCSPTHVRTRRTSLAGREELWRAFPIDVRPLGSERPRGASTQTPGFLCLRPPFGQPLCHEFRRRPCCSDPRSDKAPSRRCGNVELLSSLAHSDPQTCTCSEYGKSCRTAASCRLPAAGGRRETANPGAAFGPNFGPMRPKSVDVGPVRLEIAPTLVGD